MVGTDRREDQRDHQQVQEVVFESWDDRGDRDQGDDGRSGQVAPHHDLFTVEPIRDHAGRRSKQHGGHRVGEQRHGHRGAAARDVIGKDDQREEKELVRQLRGQLSEPDVAERGV
jgi:hypothetical protein